MENSTTSQANPPTGTQSDPLDLILQSFNALDPKIAQDPSRILNNLSNYKRAGTDLSKFATRNSCNTGYISFYEEYNNAESTYKNSAQSFQLSGRYGCYSASCQVEHSSSESQSSTNFYSLFTSEISYGNCDYNKPTAYTEMAGLLKPAMIAALNAIYDLASAEAFTKTYGTHLILGLPVGGKISIITKIATSSYADKTTISGKVSGSYQGGTESISAAVTASQGLAKSGSSYKIIQEMQFLGGDPALASNAATSSEAMMDWANSCNDPANATTYGINNICEIWNLATNKAAQKILQDYLNLCLLKKSIENPVIFSNNTTVSRGKFINVTANTTESRLVVPGYKIISGGAMLPPGSSNFLTSSCPTLVTEGNNPPAVNGWYAESHDLVSPTKDDLYLTSFAIAVFDETDILDITCVKKEGTSSKQPGPDSALALMDAGHILTGGGCQTDNGEKAAKYITCCGPVISSGNSNYDGWQSDVLNYPNNNSTVSLHSFAIGIAISSLFSADYKDCSIVINQIRNEPFSGNNGNTFVSCNNLAGGGFMLANPNKGNNLAQATFPSNNGWQEYSKGPKGEELTKSTVYTISLKMTCTCNGSSITLQPYNT